MFGNLGYFFINMFASIFGIRLYDISWDLNYFNIFLFLAIIAYKKRPNKTEKGGAMLTLTILFNNMALALSGITPITL